MRDPHKTLLPRDQWSADLPGAKVWVESDTEWENIVRNCAERQLWCFITPDELVWHNEQPLLVGAFGVPKPERKVSKTGSPVLRLIMNAIPVNAVQSLIHGDIRSLPYHGQFHAMEILDGDLLVTMSIEDLTSAFNLIELGDPWMPFQALGKPVPGALGDSSQARNRPFAVGQPSQPSADDGIEKRVRHHAVHSPSDLEHALSPGGELPC